MIQDTINSFHLEDIKNEAHPSVFFQDESYDLFILRLLNKDGDRVFSVNNSFIITKEKYYHYDVNTASFSDLNDIKGFYKILDRNIDITMKIIAEYFEKIENIEDIIYNGKSVRDFNKQWFIFKDDLVRINRVLFKAIEALSDLIHNYKQADDYLPNNFEDIEEHIKRAYRNSGHLLEKLDALYNFYLTQNNEQMNRTVYILTILSGIFLPLNFIVGFFGMNTTSLFFTEGSGGTFKVISVLISVGIASTLLAYFLKKR